MLVSSKDIHAAIQSCEEALDPRAFLLLFMYRPFNRKDLVPDRIKNTVQMARRKDAFNRSPVHPVPLCEEELMAVEKWRQEVGRHVKTRMETYNIVSASADTVLQASKREVSDEDVKIEFSGGDAACTCLNTAELLCAILEYARPQDQVRALRVSELWRMWALDIIAHHASKKSDKLDETKTTGKNAISEITSRFVLSHSTLGYGQAIRYEDSVLPTVAEKRDLYQRAESLIKLPLCAYEDVHAVFAKLHGPPGTISQPHPDSSPQMVRRGHHAYVDICCLDLSQLQINPYLEALFSVDNRITHCMGRWEINLRAAATVETLILGSSEANKLLAEKIGSMQVTYPPCRCLGLYKYSRWEVPSDSLLVKIRNDNGLLISEILKALNKAAPAALRSWVDHTIQLRAKIRKAHWLDNIWDVPGKPSIRIHLDHSDMPANWTNGPRGGSGYYLHPTRKLYLHVEPDRRTREGEWIPDSLFEPMESQTGRAPIKWDSRPVKEPLPRA